MGYKIGDDVTSWKAIAAERCKPRAYIFDSDWNETQSGVSIDGLLSNQGYIRQYISNKQSDDSTAWSGDPQIHDGTNGCLLGWPLAGINIDDRQANASATENDYNSQFPIVYGEVLAGTSYLNRPLYRWPVFIPAGHEYASLHVIADEKFANLSPKVQLYNTSFTAQSFFSEGFNYYPNEYRYEFPIHFSATGQVWILSLDIDVTNINTNSTVQSQIYGAQLFPRYWRAAQNVDSPTEITLATGNMTPLVGSSFNWIYDSFVGSKVPLSSKVTYEAAENDGYLFELATGARATGAGSATVSGHNHNGTAARGATIDMPLLCKGTGWVVIPSAGNNGLASTEGAHGSAPHLTNNSVANTYYNADHCPVYIPDRNGATTVNWCATVFDADGNGGKVRISRSSDFSSWTDSTAQQTTSSNWNFVSGTLGSVTSNAGRYIRIQFTVDENLKAMSSNTRYNMTGWAVYLT